MATLTSPTPNGHLGYLLTAYLFDSLSVAGRKEVEAHLETCAHCREHLAALRLTLGAVEKALDKGGKEFVFEERRRVRVLEAAYHSRHGLWARVPVIGGTSWKLAAVAAVLMVVVLLGLLLPTLARSRMSARRMAPSVRWAADEAPSQEKIDKDGRASHSRTFLDTSNDSGFLGGLFGSKKPAAPSKRDAEPAPKGADYDGDSTVTITELQPARPGMKPDTKSAESRSETRWGESTQRQFAQGHVSPTPPPPAPAATAAPSLPQPQSLVDTVKAKHSTSPATPSAVAGNKLAPAKPNSGLFPTGGGPGAAKDLPAQTAGNWVPSEGGPDTTEAVDESRSADKVQAGEGDAAAKLGSRSGGGRKLTVTRHGGARMMKEEPAPAEAPAAVEIPEILNKILPAQSDGQIAVAAGRVAFDAEKKPADARQEKLAELSGRARQAAEPSRKTELKSLLSELDDAQDQGKAVATPPPLPPAGAALADDINDWRDQGAAAAIVVPAPKAEERAKGEKLAEQNAPANEELQREVRRSADELQKAKGVVLKQQQALATQEAKEKSVDHDISGDSYTRPRLKSQQQGQQPAKDGKPADLEPLDKHVAKEAEETLSPYQESGKKPSSAKPRPAADPASREARDVVVPPEILAQAGLGDHFETVNPDRPDTKSAFGNAATLYFSYQTGKDAGGGGTSGKEIEDLVGVGGVASPGTGGGWGGGQGTGAAAKKIPGLAKAPMLGALFKTADGKVAADAGYLEGLLRGYRYFRSENEKLRFRDFLRRPAPVPPAVLTDDGLDEDLYIERHGTRPFVDCARDHFSTFGMDVDTASYTRTRSQLREGKLPEADTVRVEEFLNYFKQPYEVTGDDAFGVFAEGAPSPFRGTGVSPVSMAETAMVRGTGVSPVSPVELLKIGIKSRDPRPDERKPAMLTFVVDTSGSMNRDNRLSLAKAALRALIEELSPEDAVSIVGFSDQAELALPRTQARQKQRILDAIDALTPHGSTNVEAGLNMGYRLADECYSPDAVNRMILCSDGVANVGAKGPEEILKLVKVFADRGIDLSAVGFGRGAYNDQMMMRLADSGNGSCHFVDKADEARRVFTEQLPPHLNVLARDAKVQVDFNPDVVARYRLLGYEKRKIADKDFRNDKIDAGEVAHSTLITVMYEIVRKPGSHGALGKVFLRWKDAGYRHLPVVERNYPLSEGVMAGDIRGASPELRFLAGIARFAELLRASPWVRDGSYTAVLDGLRQLPPEFQERPEWQEVCELVRRAQELSVKRWMQEIQ